MEKIAVVNKNNKLLSYNNYANVHTKRLWHRTVHILLFNNDKILLAKRNNNKYSTSCGGHVRYKESCKNAMKRELKEELGIDKLIFKRLYSFRNITQKGKNKENLVLYIGTYNGKIYIDKNEVISTEWINKDKLKKDINNKKYTDTLRNVLLHLK